MSVGHKCNLILIEVQWSLPSRHGGHEGERDMSSELFSCTVGRVCRVRGSAWQVSQCNGEMLVCTACALARSECTGKQGLLGCDCNVL